MTAGIREQITQDALATLRELDDGRFWEQVATFGYHRPAPEEADLEQAWFWTRRWVTMELEADLDQAEGRTTFYASDEEFLASLEEDITDDADVREG